MRLLIGSATALILGLILTPVVRDLARRYGFVAKPREDRWHREPTAMLGGIAIYVAFMAAYLGFGPATGKVIPILLAGSLLFVVGLVDDIIRLKPQTKLVAQLIAAAVVVNSGLHLQWTRNDALNSLITILWLVGITNAINLLDNMDGLAAGIAGIACVFLTTNFLLNGQVAEALIPAVLGGVILSFLVFNLNPASIFMGDSGSMFLGFMLSASALLSESGRTRDLYSVLLTPVLIMMIPIFDTCVVIISRKLYGRAVSDGGCDHTSHRLVAMGMTERRAVLMFYGFAGVSGTLALLVRLLKPESILVLIPAFTVLVLLLGLQLGKVRVYKEGAPVRGFRLVSALADFSYKRRVLEVLLDMVLVVLAYYGAYLLQFGGNLPSDQIAGFTASLPLIIAAQMSCLWIGGVYRGEWRYAQLSDMFVIARSVLAGTALSALLLVAVTGFMRPSPEVVIVNFLLLLAFVAASRLSFRVLRNLIQGRAKPFDHAAAESGTGFGGEMMFQDIILRTAVGLGCVLVLATVFSFSSFAAPQTKTGVTASASSPDRKVPTIAGSVSGTGSVSVNGNMAANGTTLLSQSSISTGKDGRATVNLGSLGQIRLLPDSAIRLAVNAGQVQVNLIRGSMIQSLAAGAKGEIGLPEGRSGLSVERGQVRVPTGGLTFNTGEQTLFAGATRATIAGNSLVVVTAAGSESVLSGLGYRTGKSLITAQQTQSRSLTALALESIKGEVEQVTSKQTGDAPPENALMLTTVGPTQGGPRRPPASPIRP